MQTNPLTPAQLEQLRRLSTCIAASAIEGFHIQLPNTGFADSSIRCLFENRAPVAGYAATARIRTSAPPMEGRSYSYERTDWWNHILSIPAPRMVILEDADNPPGLGAFVGEVNANILLAMGCVALVTNGAVRDLNEVAATGFQMFAGSVSVSHAYAHIFEFGGPVEVGKLEIRPGDLIHADRNGVHNIPLEIAAQLPESAHRIALRRQRLIELCRSTEFSIDKLRAVIHERETKP